ncbi:MAG: hypothetical protein H0T89_08295 [Deltaproteobacteria bacterium]|nr:hypothetical protein [Deltaproteobacteria bacterium]
MAANGSRDRLVGAPVEQQVHRLVVTITRWPERIAELVSNAASVAVLAGMISTLSFLSARMQATVEILLSGRGAPTKLLPSFVASSSSSSSRDGVGFVPKAFMKGRRRQRMYCRNFAPSYGRAPPFHS